MQKKTDIPKKNRNRVVIIFFTFLSFLHFSFIGFSQMRHSYYFDGDFTANRGLGPTLQEFVSCGASKGSFSKDSSMVGECSYIYNFEKGAGLGYKIDNTLMSGHYFSINIWFSFNELGNFRRIIDFSNSTLDYGIYLLHSTLNFFPNGAVGPTNFFFPDSLYLMTFTRDTGGLFTIYVNGIYFSSYADVNDYYRTKFGNDFFVFFYDDNVKPCEVGAGKLRYLDVRNYPMSKAEVEELWTIFEKPEITKEINEFLCIGDSTTLTAVSPSGTNGSHRWSIGSTAPTVTVSPTENATYRCTYSYNICSTVNSIFHIDIQNTKPSLQIPAISFCRDSVGILTAIPSISGGSFLWSNGETSSSILVSDSVTTTYSCTYDFGFCTANTVAIVQVNQPKFPTFNPIEPFCAGTNASILPVISEDSIVGTWTPPAIDNLNSMNYTFEPLDGQCATNATVAVTIIEKTNPTFNELAPICSGAVLAPLPFLSNNDVPGRWSPETNNLLTTEYTFTPDSGQCATTTSMIVSVKEYKLPSFTAIEAICSGEEIAPLPLLSNNDIHGSWTPPINNTASTTYTFSPDSGQCIMAESATLLITVNEKINPTFSTVETICEGDYLAPLPTISLNDINGSWAPPLNNTSTTLYTFTPDAEHCASTTSMIIQVDSILVPSFKFTTNFCAGAVIPPLPSTSNNAVHGNWKPNLNNSTSTLYTFTPDSGSCAADTSLEIKIHSLPQASFEFSPSFITIQEPFLSFTNTSTGASSYDWSFNNSFSTSETNPSLQFSSHSNEPQNVRLISITSFGCRDTAIAILRKEIYYYVPNTFTPDNNLFNEVFKPTFPPESEPSLYCFQIMNRWGQTVYTTNNPSDGWQGENYLTQGKCPDGIYTWRLEFKDFNTGDPVEKTGFVNLIR
jgi:hypothetical protein